MTFFPWLAFCTRGKVRYGLKHIRQFARRRSRVVTRWVRQQFSTLRAAARRLPRTQARDGFVRTTVPTRSPTTQIMRISHLRPKSGNSFIGVNGQTRVYTARRLFVSSSLRKVIVLQPFIPTMKNPAMVEVVFFSCGDIRQ